MSSFLSNEASAEFTVWGFFIYNGFKETMNHEEEVKRTIQLISGINKKEIDEMFENFGIYAVLLYTKKEKIVIPFIGEVTINSYDTGLRCDFVPSSFLLRNIGQIEDGEETEFENLLARKFKPVLMPQQEKKKHSKTKMLKTETVKEDQGRLS